MPATPNITEDIRQAFLAANTFEETQDITNLEGAITAWERVLGNPVLKHQPSQLHLSVLTNAGLAFMQRYYYITRSLSDLDQAVRLWNDALPHTSINLAILPVTLNELGDALSQRYYLTKQIEDLEKSIRYYRDAVAHVTASTSELPLYLDHLGTALYDHYECTGNLQMLEEAIKVHHRTLKVTPKNSPDLHRYFHSAGNALAARYNYWGEIKDLEEAIVLHQKAVNYPSPDVYDFPHYLSALANDLKRRFEYWEEIKDLERALQLHRQAIKIAPSNFDTSYLRTNLAISLSNQYEYTEELELLEEAIQIFQGVVQQHIGDTRSPDLPDYLINLSKSLGLRYERLEQPQDWEQALASVRQAIDLTPKTSPYLPDCYHHLGGIFIDKFEQQMHLESLQEASKYYQIAVEATPPTSSSLPRYLYSLAGSLSRRYGYTGTLADLQEAITLLQKAMELTSLGPRSLLATLQHALGFSLKDLYERTTNLEDLDQAITLLREVVDNPFRRPSFLAEGYGELGNTLRKRFLKLKHSSDLEEAIVALEKAVSLYPSKSYELAGMYGNLGNALQDKYNLTQQLQVLEEVITAFRTSKQLSQNSKMIKNRPMLLNGLGNALKERYKHFGSQEDLQEAVEAYEEACQLGLQFKPEVALGCARSWGRWATDRATWEEAARAYTYAVRAIEHLYSIQILQTHREDRLGEVVGIYDRAAYAMARAGKLREAVTTLEYGRAKRLREVLNRDYTDLQHVKDAVPEVYERYQDAVNRLRYFEQEERTGHFFDKGKIVHISSSVVDASKQINKVREDLKRAIADIRRIPGCDKFFVEPTSYQEIMSVTNQHVPIVYITITLRGSMSLLVYNTKEEPELLLEEAFTEYNLRHILQKLGKDFSLAGYIHNQVFGSPMLRDSLAEILPELGNHLIRPVAQLLSNRGVSAVVVVPTGLLGILPLHAATYQKDGKETTLLEEFDVAFAPSARVLGMTQHQAQVRQSETLHFLGIGDPSKNLIYARTEVENVVHLVNDESSVALYEDQATNDTVWQKIPSATIAHFACHGKFEPDDPLASALYLANETRLTLRDLLNAKPQRLSHLRMAVLSACDSALINPEHLPDEVIGLPAGFMQAGIPSVIGTLWHVDDQGTALLIVRFYELLLHGDAKMGLPTQSPARALRLAQRWLRELTNDDVVAYSQSHLPRQVLLGVQLDEEARAYKVAKDVHPYANPYYWAPFVYWGVL